MSTGTLSEAIEVKATAAKAWKVYGTLQLDYIVLENRPDIFQNIEILQGNGGVGTLIKDTFPPGMPGPTYQIEKLTVVDDEKRLRISELIEGGYLALGFTKYQVMFHVLEMDENTCITKATVEYEIGEDASNKASFVSVKPYVTIMNVIADYLTNPN